MSELGGRESKANYEKEEDDCEICFALRLLELFFILELKLLLCDN